eukprot:3232384-Alexandrium_andersonii.AAC.1
MSLTWASLRRKRRRYSLRQPSRPGPMPCLRPLRRLRICFAFRPVCLGAARSTLAGPGPRSGVAHIASAIAAPVAALGSAMPAGTKA